MASKTKAQSDKKKRDPFAYFGGLGCDDVDDELSESDNEEEEIENDKLSFISKRAAGDNQSQEKLPAAEDVLFVNKQPEFLKQDKKRVVDWDKLVKDDTKEEEEPVNYSTNAIPPPKTYDPVSEPIKPSIGDNSEEANRNGKKRCSTDDAETESPKKSKADSS